MNANDFSEWLIGVLDRHDPVGLLTASNPGREYKPEARAIMAALPYAPTLHELVQSIHDIFAYYFDDGIAGPMERYADIALEIHLHRH